MDRRHLTSAEAMAEPNEVIEHALMIWDLDHIRDNLKSGSNN